jgi:hypothetical protein
LAIEGIEALSGASLADSVFDFYQYLILLTIPFGGILLGGFVIGYLVLLRYLVNENGDPKFGGGK